MAKLEYKSLVTKEIIDYYLSKIKDNENLKKDSDKVQYPNLI